MNYESHLALATTTIRVVAILDAAILGAWRDDRWRGDLGDSLNRIDFMTFRTPVRTQRKNKYNARKVRIDGFTFDSKREAERYGELMLMQRAGEIHQIEVHPPFKIEINNRPICTVVLDFAYVTKAGDKVHEDVKGHTTALSALKKKMVEAAHQIDVEIVK